MKTLKLIALGLTLCFAYTLDAQNAEEIIENYIENIGGQEAWSKIESMTVTGIGRQQGVDYPFTATYMKDGRYVIDVNLQGSSFIVEAFDGKNAWAMNFNTQKAEADDSETSANTKNDAKDEMINSFYNYKEKGYAIELIGKDIWDGTDVYKIKLTKKPLFVDGKPEENIVTYYFDTENFVPIASETVIKSGPAKGATALSTYSNYQEVDGLYKSFSQIDKFNGQIGLEMTIENVIFNADVDENIFKIPVATINKKN